MTDHLIKEIVQAFYYSLPKIFVLGLKEEMCLRTKFWTLERSNRRRFIFFTWCCCDQIKWNE